MNRKALPVERPRGLSRGQARRARMYIYNIIYEHKMLYNIEYNTNVLYCTAREIYYTQNCVSPQSSRETESDGGCRLYTRKIRCYSTVVVGAIRRLRRRLDERVSLVGGGGIRGRRNGESEGTIVLLGYLRHLEPAEIYVNTGLE